MICRLLLLRGNSARHVMTDLKTVSFVNFLLTSCFGWAADSSLSHWCTQNILYSIWAFKTEVLSIWHCSEECRTFKKLKMVRYNEGSKSLSIKKKWAQGYSKKKCNRRRRYEVGGVWWKEMKEVGENDHTPHQNAKWSTWEYSPAGTINQQRAAPVNIWWGKFWVHIDKAIIGKGASFSDQRP